MEIKKIGVLGSGTMGKGIVELLITQEYQVIWIGSSVEKLKNKLEEIANKLEKLRVKKRISFAGQVSEYIKISTGITDLESCDLIIEAIVENTNKKMVLLEKISKIIKPNAILATNTSSLSITQLASVTKNIENFIGIHFFNPAPIMKLVEIIKGLNTSENTLNIIENFIYKIDKNPILVDEAPGFVVNRMLIPMINEAISILADGVASAEDIDRAMKLGANHPIGPLALADLIGNDINLSIMETLFNETGDSKYRPHPLLRKMVRGNKLGRKTKVGFFNY